jgi:membrane protease YdiL (CAAX protease family)
MSEAPATILDPHAPELPVPATTPSRILRWFELILVLLVAFTRSIQNAVYLLHHSPTPNVAIGSDRWILGLFHEIIALLLLGYVLSRRSGVLAGLQRLGLRWSFRDIGIGFLLWGVSRFVYIIVAGVVHLLLLALGHPPVTPTSAKEIFGHPGFAAIPFFLLTPLFEELIVRAYLMTEVLELTGSSTLAILLSVLLQASYHLYYGWAGAFYISFIFLCFALFYARTRRALPVVVAHGFQDIFGLIRLW